MVEPRSLCPENERGIFVGLVGGLLFGWLSPANNSISFNRDAFASSRLYTSDLYLL
jgi:hypothetical protein